MIIEDQAFSRIYDRNSGRLIEGIHLRRCSFKSCALSVTTDPLLRTTVRNVTVTGCSVTGSSSWGAFFDEVLVDGLRTSGLLMVNAAAFRHVRLRGKIGRIMINPLLPATMGSAEQQERFDRANAAIYTAADWALDISEADFVEADIRGVPADLVRREPHSQAVVRRENVLDGRWQNVDLSGSYWASSIQVMLRLGLPEIILVCARQDARFQDQVTALARLRDVGIADPT